MRRSACLASLAVVLFWSLLITFPAAAQYFGRNKVQYDDFDFQVLRTEHFDIYFYPEEEQAARDAARMAERWYRRHTRTFLREFKERKPIIFYANDADFHQTNVIGGSIGEGTGGVTEGLKQRVVMPMTGSYAETDHVLGHELVHSFQYDIGLSREDTIRFALGALPLWLMEGMAEYLSVGRVDPHTAMWLRDAVIRDDLPTLEQLSRDYRYFPYRYGQAYLAYIGGKYGDVAVTSLYKLAGRVGLDTAMVYTIGITPDSLSREWIRQVKSIYTPLMEGRDDVPAGARKVLAEDLDAGEMNLAPAISPDGKYVAFLSELDLFNINLFIADAETGEVIKRLKSGNADPHFDAIRFINSAGTWSPDGKKLAFVTFVQGDNEITVFDVDRRDIERRFAVAGVSALSNPAWSPDGRSIAFTGLDGGISDLYVLDVETNAVRQLTADRYADFQPAWSPDGRTIAFMTDRGPDGTDFETLEYANYRLGLIDVASGETRVVEPFDGALHHNPQFSPDGRSLYFISDQDGFKDVYRYALDAGTVARLTHLKTGVSGITNTSPAMSVASQSGRMLFSVFADNNYTVYALEGEQTQGTPVDALPGVATAGVLPPILPVNEGIVGNYLSDPETGLPSAEVAYETRSYRSRLRLDYVAPPSVGVAAGGPFGTQIGGGIGFFFSDMLGNQNLSIAVQANGTFKDIGGQASYINLGDRFNYGATAGHIPLLYGYAGAVYDPRTGQQYIEQLMQRIFIDQAALLGQYPFSTTRRVEVSGGFVRYGFDYEIEQYIITPQGFVDRRRISASSGESLVFPELQEPDAIYFFSGSAAYVGDYSFFGFTSPVQGGRYRFQVSPQIGTEKFVSAVLDYRRYLFFKPFTFALRGLHIGNYGANRGDLFTQQYLGYSYYPGFVRGYSFRSFDFEECTNAGGTVNSPQACPEYDRLRGTHMALASAEIRLPLFGTEQFGLLNFPYLPTELSLFTDAGVAWYQDDLPELVFSTDPDDPRRIPVVSAGVSARFNVLGYIIFEAFYAYPFQRPEKGAHFGFQLMPGW